MPAWVNGLAAAVAQASSGPVVIALHGAQAEALPWVSRIAWRIDALLFGACKGLAFTTCTLATQPSRQQIALCAGTEGQAEVSIELTVGGRPAAELEVAVDEAAHSGHGEIEVAGVLRHGAAVVGCMRWHVYLDERSRHRACENVLTKLVKLAAAMVDGIHGQAELAHAAPPRLPMHGVRERLGPLGRSARHALRRLGWHDQWAITVFRGLREGELWPHGQGIQGIDLLPPKTAFWADPFLFHKDGLLWVFFEELPFATERGHISVVSIDDLGQVSAPAVVLKPPWHLSYPNVFEHEGEIYMVPESGSQANVVLYRARAFPLEWEPVAELLSGVRSADATFHHDGTHWWLMCAIAEGPESIYDQLALFKARQLHGPFERVSRLPAVVDTAVARPAGPLFRHQGRWVRPAQDCRRRYGRGLQLLEMSIGPDGQFSQTALASVEGSASGAMGVHTYCRVGTDLAVDWYRWVPKRGGAAEASARMLAFHEHSGLHGEAGH